MTTMTLMTMNCRGCLKAVRHSAVVPRGGVVGWEPRERKCVNVRCRSEVWTTLYFCDPCENAYTEAER